MSGVFGNHRQSGTLRLLSYQVFYKETRPGFVAYAGGVTETERHHCENGGEIAFDCTVMSADEAVRADICRFIDSTAFGEGTPPDPILLG